MRIRDVIADLLVLVALLMVVGVTLATPEGHALRVAPQITGGTP